jgi:hypothetical protein
MRHGTTERVKTPARTASIEAVDPEVVEFREAFEAKSTLDEIVREGARKMLQTAIEVKVGDFLTQHANRRDKGGQASGRAEWFAALQGTPHGSRFFGGEAAAGS